MGEKGGDRGAGCELTFGPLIGGSSRVSRTVVPVVPAVEERAVGTSSNESVGDGVSGYNENCE